MSVALHRPDALMEPEEVLKPSMNFISLVKSATFGNQNPGQWCSLSSYLDQALLSISWNFGPAHVLLDASLNATTKDLRKYQCDG